MLNFLKKVWHDPVWSKVIAVGIIAVITQYLFSWMGTFFQLGRSSLEWLMGRSEVSNWFILITVLCAFIVVILLLATLWQAIRPNQVGEDWEKHYRKDVFHNILWRWSYSYSGQIENIRSFCPTCNFQIYAQSGGGFDAVPHTIFQCDSPSCHKAKLYDHSGRHVEIENLVGRMIQQKIHNRSWHKGEADITL